MLILATLNSQYVHSNLALKYLVQVARQSDEACQVMEFTINDSLDDIGSTIVRAEPEVLAFSCYIWNIEDTIKLTQNLKKVLPKVTIVVGGPEVSYDAVRFLKDNPFIDLIIRGEGEETFGELLLAWREEQNLQGIAGLTWRQGDQIHHNPDRSPLDLNKIPLAYGIEPITPDGRILYYETSRGCPFNCSYCLSSTIRGVRYFDLERVRREILALVSSGVSQVKFVDRSFNCHPPRALELMRFLADLPGETNFHFEIVADILTSEMIDFLSTVKPGKFQFEIGIQSTNPRTLKMINRHQDLNRIAENIKALQKGKNIRIHLDLIAGLPQEDYQSLANSFNWVYDLKPDYLQLGFLKLLKGTSIREKASQWGYVFKDYPPYEVLSNLWLSFGEISTLKLIEDLLQRYYNSHVFGYTLDYSIEHLFQGDAFRFYEALAEYYLDQGLASRRLKRQTLYINLMNFLKQLTPAKFMTVKQILILDFVINNRDLNVPEELGRTQIENQGPKTKAYLRGRRASDPNLKRSTRLRIEVFPIDILALVGIREPVDSRPWYPVLFQYGEEQTILEYIEL